MTTTRQKAVITVLAGLTLTGALAGCAADESAVAEPQPRETPSAGESTTAPAETDGASTYDDGTYSASGSYQSPHGIESVDVTVTLAGDVITAVTVVGNGDNPESQQYQGEFIGGIASVVVGQDIDSLSVSRVAGSSLTSGGFNAAIESIKADAA